MRCATAGDGAPHERGDRIAVNERTLLVATLAAIAATLSVTAASRFRDRQNAVERAASAGREEIDQALAGERLRRFDAERRLGADFARLPTWDRMSGPDPYAIAALPATNLVVGILRGEDALVALDRSMHEVARVAAPSGAVTLTVAADGAVLVAGELAPAIARFVWKDGSLEPAGTFQLDGRSAIRAIAAGTSDWIYVAEELEGHVLAFRIERTGSSGRLFARREMGACRGPIRAERVRDRLIVDCLLDHQLVVYRLHASGEPRAEPPVVIRHDGPIWCFDAAASEHGLVVVAGGVEDHPLDRTIGAFGYVDSFLFLYELDDAADTAVRKAAVDLSEIGVVTPKAVALEAKPLSVTVSGYGSDTIARLTFADDASSFAVRTETFVPGTSATVRLADGDLAFANPLLDAWIVAPRDQPFTVVPASSAVAAPADREVRLGEALFFTTAIAPYASAEGPLSRFTCETCHYEGYVDGRAHHTGRDDVHAVTKPLLGLFNNRPHCSRALDPDLTAVVFNEFRVAGAKSGHDPWFALSASDLPWARFLGWPGATFTPETLRRALMSFLIAFRHRPNPAVVGRTGFSALARAGAMRFRDRCESCHEARLASDQPATRVPFESWETFVFSREDPIVWGKDAYAKTGVVPYVHEKGARIPSLRRLYKKHPYFTNGAATSVADVLRRVRFSSAGFLHDVAPSQAAAAERPVDTALDALDEASRDAVLAFLRLL